MLKSLKIVEAEEVEIEEDDLEEDETTDALDDLMTDEMTATDVLEEVILETEVTNKIMKDQDAQIQILNLEGNQDHLDQDVLDDN